MLKNCLGIINITTKSDSFGTLTAERPAYMLPFAGRYRLVDFPLSNLVNHKIGTVAIYTGVKVRSVMDHIQTGRPWGLDRRRNGIHIYTPHFKNVDPDNEVSEYHLTLDFFKKTKEDNLIFITQNKISQVHLGRAYQHFDKSNADVTFIYTEVENNEQLLYSENVVLDEDGNFVNIGINLVPTKQLNLFNGAFFIKKATFIDLITHAAEIGKEKTLIDVILNNADNLKINTYKSTSYIEDIKDLRNYYNASMNLLNSDKFHQLFYNGGAVLTKTKDEPPTLYGNDSIVENSLVANGCVINGEVENSVIFRGVVIEKGAVVKDSIIMQKSVVKAGAIIDKSILDKGAKISENVVIVGTKSNPYVVGKNEIIRKA